MNKKLKAYNPIQWYLVVSLTFILAFIGCSKDKLPCKDSVYTYDEQRGRCTDCAGNIGYNHLDIDEVKKTKNAECSDLSKISLTKLIDTTNSGNERESAQQQLVKYNFKGCLFDSAKLMFSDIYDANFEGADLSKIEYGYANLHGAIDTYTVPPEKGKLIHQSADSMHFVQ